MKVYVAPERTSWHQITKRPVLDTAPLMATVQQVFEQVKALGDTALLSYTQQFDRVALNNLVVTPAEVASAIAHLPQGVKQAIDTAASNIRTFHTKQLQTPEVIETMPGVQCWRKSIGIEKVGLYIPGGSAPLFSTVLMLAIPASIAGCKEIVLCTPPGKDGTIHPAILYAAHITGVTTIVKLGGIQAIAAMSIGTATVPRVYKIFGPGNQYVTAAKQYAQQLGIAIDMPAGPSEVCVYADASAKPAFVAADLLSQAEHGADSQVLLVVNDEQVLPPIQAALEEQLAMLPRSVMATSALHHSAAVVLPNIEDAFALINSYAPEHFIISTNNAVALAEKVINAGSVFIGHYTPESVGDYASGTNHTLPTNGFATAYSGVSVDSFVKKVTFQQLTKAGLEQLADTVVTMATAEGLTAHANAVQVRLK